MANFSIAYQFKAITGQFQNKVKQLDSSLGVLHSNMKKRNQHIKQFGKNLSSVGKSMTMKVTAPILALGTAGIYTFSKLEKGLLNVKGLASDKAWEKFGKQFAATQKTAVEFGFSIDDVNKSLFAVPSGLGINKRALEGFNAAMKLSIAGDAKLEAASEGIVRVLAAYGDQLRDAEQAASGLFQAQVIGVTNVEKLAGNVGKITSNSKLADLSFGEMIATAAGLTKVLPTEQALTSMNALLASLLTPTPDQVKTIKAIGKVYKIDLPLGARALQKADFFTVLKDIITIAKKDPDALTALIPEQRAVKAMGAMTQEILAQVKATAKSIDTGKDAAELNRAYIDHMQSADRQLKMLFGKLKIVTAQFGKELFPLLKSFINKILIPMIKWFKNLSPATKKWVVVIGLLAAAIGPLLIVLGSLITTLAILTTVPVVAGIVGIAAAIGGLIAAGTLLWKNWSRIWGGIKSFVLDIVNAVDVLIQKMEKLTGMSIGPSRFKGDIESRIMAGSEIMPEVTIASRAQELKGQIMIETKDKDDVVKSIEATANRGINMNISAWNF